MATISITASDLRPLVAEVAHEILARHIQAVPPERIGFTETEAAALIGLKKHNLRDARLRGEVSGRRVGRRVLYERGELMRFVAGVARH